MNSAENSSVAAVIPTFNSEKVVVRALDSVVNQSVRPREIIVVDDASTDGTVEVVRKFAEQHTEVELIVNERNLGPGPTRNKGWSLAKSDFVAFLDADDSWHPQKIERQLKFFAEHPGEVACGTTHLIADRNCAQTTIKGDASQISRFSLTDLLRRNRFSTPSAMLRQDITQRFDSNLRLAEDYLLWMSIAAEHGHVSRIEQPLTTLYKPIFGSAGLSSKTLPMFLGEIKALNALRMNRSISSPRFLLSALWSALKLLRRLPTSTLRRLIWKLTNE